MSFEEIRLGAGSVTCNDEPIVEVEVYAKNRVAVSLLPDDGKYVVLEEFGEAPWAGRGILKVMKLVSIVSGIFFKLKAISDQVSMGTTDKNSFGYLLGREDKATFALKLSALS